MRAWAMLPPVLATGADPFELAAQRLPLLPFEELGQVRVLARAALMRTLTYHAGADVRSPALASGNQNLRRDVARKTAGRFMLDSAVETLSVEVVEATPPGLRHVSDSGPAIRRRRAGKGFVYIDAHGRRIADPRTLARIRSIVVPPAWTEVWICPKAAGHIQATGRDVKGRKQYRYHPDYREAREEAKFEHMLRFAEALPAIRAAVAE